MNEKTKIKHDGTTINQPPIQFPTADPQWHKADKAAILRTKKPKLLRKYAQQQINANLRRGGQSSSTLEKMATRPDK